VREHGFELRLCAALEDGERLVARQLGAHVHGRRVVDVICLEPGSAFAERAAITPETIPPRAIESDVGLGRPTPVREAFDCHPEAARETVEAAVDVGFFVRTRRNGQPAVRQTARYPEGWFDSLVGIECKPDLARPGALEAQLLTDARLGLLDRVVLATASHVTGAHVNRLPDPVGVWEFDPESGERRVVCEAESLPTTDAGVEIVDRSPVRTDVRIATATAKARHRRRLAERAYGKGWRPRTLPGCARVEADADGVPHCPWKGRIVHAPSDCGEACDGFEPGEAPAVDVAARRAARSAWEADPPGRRRTQAGLDSF
jgi:hypothetical protein